MNYHRQFQCDSCMFLISKCSDKNYCLYIALPVYFTGLPVNLIIYIYNSPVNLSGQHRQGRPALQYRPI